MTDSLINETTRNISSSAIGEAGAERLTNGVIWAYAVPRIGFGVMGLLFSTYLMKFSTDVLLIAPAAIGGIIAAARLWDAISDPMVGYLSDRTNSRFGRRRIWMYFAALPMAAGLVMIWSPPLFLKDMMLLAWMAAALIIYETASTAFWVPHGALGAELTPNYHERTRLYGYAHMITAIGSMMGLVALYLMDSAEDKRFAAFILSVIAGISVATLVLVSTKMLPERKDYQGRGATSAFKSFADVFRNPHSLLLLIVFAVETFGVSSVGMLVPYLVSYVIPLDQMPVEPSLFLIAVLVTYTIPQFIFTPIWIKLAGIVGKKTLWGFSLWVSALTFFGFYFALDHPVLIWVLAFFLGTCGGIGAVVEPAIKADIIDYDEYLTGERKEGSYLAVWNFIRKCAASMTALITGLVLDAVGFEPNVEQTELVKDALRSIFSLLPAFCYFIGACLFIRFKFNEKEHAEVRKVLDERNSK